MSEPSGDLGLGNTGGNGDVGGVGSGGVPPAPIPPNPTPPASNEPNPEIAELRAKLALLEGQVKQNEPKAPTDPANPTGGFNDELPPEIADDIEIQGLFKLGKQLYPTLDFERVLRNAWDSGDPALLDRNYLREVAGDDFQYIEQYLTNIVSVREDRAASVLTTAHDKVGGAENWQTVVGAFNKEADPAILSYVKSLVDSGNMSQIETGLGIIINHATQRGYLSTQGAKVNTPNIGSSSNALSSADFGKELNELSTKAFELGDKKYAEAYNSLVERRKLGKQLGL